MNKTDFKDGHYHVKRLNYEGFLYKTLTSSRLSEWLIVRSLFWLFHYDF